jgi:hypothetical protein
MEAPGSAQQLQRVPLPMLLVLGLLLPAGPLGLLLSRGDRPARPPSATLATARGARGLQAA